MEYLVFFLLVFIFFYSIRKMVNIHAYFFPSFLSFIYIYTFIGSQIFNFSIDIPFSDQLIGNRSIFEAGVSYALSSLFFIVGIIFGKKKYVFGRYILINNNYLPVKKAELKINSNFSLWFSISVVVFSFFTFDLEHILYRDSYAFEIDPVFQNIHKLLFLVGVFLCAFINNKFLKYSMLFLILVYPFSMNSRLLVFGVFLFFSGLYLKNRYIDFFNKILFIFLISISIFSTLGLRSMKFQGLLPNLSNLLSFNFNLNDILESINYVTSFSVFATQYAIDNNIGDFKSFLISINPMFGEFLDTKYLIDNNKINIFAPSPAIALLYNQGVFIICFYYLLCGFIFNKLLMIFRSNPFYSIFFGMFMLFTLLNTQYLLRESVRLLYYCIFLATFLKIFSDFFLKRKV